MSFEKIDMTFSLCIQYVIHNHMIVMKSLYKLFFFFFVIRKKTHTQVIRKTTTQIHHTIA